jgi:hypothetical protein
MRFYYCVIFPNINSLIHERAVWLSFNTMCNKIHLCISCTEWKYVETCYYHYLFIFFRPQIKKKKKIDIKNIIMCAANDYMVLVTFFFFYQITCEHYLILLLYQWFIQSGIQSFLRRSTVRLIYSGKSNAF